MCIIFLSFFETTTTCRSFFFCHFWQVYLLRVCSSYIGCCFYYKRDFLFFMFLFTLWLFLPSQLFLRFCCFGNFFLLSNLVKNCRITKKHCSDISIPFHEKSSLIFPLRSNKFSYFHLKKEFLASESNLFHSIFRTG